jgi:hypothetical protein
MKEKWRGVAASALKALESATALQQAKTKQRFASEKRHQQRRIWRNLCFWHGVAAAPKAAHQLTA